ncbi:MAG: alpha/beta hydrolase [Vannielia sp.]|uniref:alpha/beta fold hydrolase n=1 Tax=Vannielia sp. TaxID=2813045 RepID=UPI003B8BD81D
MTSALVICIHGYPGQASDFAAVGERLALGREVVSIPMPWSEDCPAGLFPGGLGLKELAEHLLTAISRLGGGKAAHLVAHDLGSLAAWAVAAVQPGAVQSLAVLSAPHPTAYRANLDALQAGGHRAYVDRLLSGQPDAPLPPLHPAEQSAADIPALDRLEAARRKTRRAPLRSLYRSVMDAEVIRAAPAMPPAKCPVTLIAGAQDPYFPAPLAEESRRASGPSAALRLLPDAGHHPHLTHPQEVAALLADHLDAVDPRAKA